MGLAASANDSRRLISLTNVSAREYIHGVNPEAAGAPPVRAPSGSAVSAMPLEWYRCMLSV